MGTQGTADKPNIIYVMVDDLGYGDLGCYGQEIIKTPNLDRMAAEGMRFTDHYAGSTVCAPSRCVLMTGKHTGHSTVVNNAETARDSIVMGDRGAAGQQPLKAGEVTLAHLAKRAGYHTACIGKWGLGSRHSSGDPRQVGFDHFFGYYDQRDAHYFYIDWLWRNGDPVELKDNPKLKTQYSHDLLFEESVQWIKQYKDHPFFLYLTFTIPHAELIVPEDSMKPYEGIEERGPWGNVKAPYRIERKQWGLYNACEKPHQTFAAMVSRLDRDMGRLLDLLKELGLDKNTLVMFTSDNGPHNEGGADPAFFNSAGPLRGGKRSLHEGGIRVPFIAWQPGKIQGGSVSRHVSAFWDIMPTLSELLKVEAPGNIDGISFLPTLYGRGPQKQHDYLYWRYGGTQAVRRGHWKAVGNDNKVRLFDLENDLGEKTDVAASYPETANELKALFKAARQPAMDKNNFEMHSIGRIKKTDGRTFIVMDEKYVPGLKGLDKHDYVIVLYWFDKNDTPQKRAILQVHPRGNRENPLTGVFATHAPFRPNLIAVTQCDIISVKDNVIEIKDIDAFDGSPVLDLKGDFFRFN